MWYYPDLTNPVVRCYACAKGVTRMIDIEKLTALAIAYDAGDAKRIQHFIKVYAYSRLLERRTLAGDGRPGGRGSHAAAVRRR